MFNDQMEIVGDEECAQMYEGRRIFLCLCQCSVTVSTELWKNFHVKFWESLSKCSSAHPKISLWRNLSASLSRNLTGMFLNYSVHNSVITAIFWVFSNSHHWKIRHLWVSLRNTRDSKAVQACSKIGTVLLNTSLAWSAVAGCSRAETSSWHSAISFAQPCNVREKHPHPGQRHAVRRPQRRDMRREGRQLGLLQVDNKHIRIWRPHWGGDVGLAQKKM